MVQKFGESETLETSFCSNLALAQSCKYTNQLRTMAPNLIVTLEPRLQNLFIKPKILENKE